MRLLFVGTSKTGGGTETHFITLAKALTDIGHEVAAVVRPDSPMYQSLKNSHVKIFTGTFRNSLDFRGVSAVNNAIKDFEPDWLVGSFSKEYWPLVYISYRRHVPLAIFRHMATKMKRGTQYFIPRLAQRFIVISNFMKELLTERGVPEQLMQVLHNPLELDYFKPDSELREQTRSDMDLANQDRLVGFVGQLHPGKGIYVLLKAIERVMEKQDNVSMLWIGTGVDEKRFREAVSRSKYKNRMIQKPYMDDMRPWYNALDLLAVPSIEFDTFGRVSIEAQACGTPVFGSRLGGIVETMQDGVTGKLLPPGDETVWEKEMSQFLAQNGETQLKDGREFVKNNFSPDKIASQFIDILEKAQPAK